ncbi:acyltransferase family protein [Methanobacterium sp. MBAC-LM]|uniref:acyltransferase family protein n=1 Tax=Methanobacterium sp. MBAC-LM TaxID=3412034 RepID=UPI003C76A592
MNESRHYLQIDILKALAIISVIVLHTIPPNMVKHPVSIFIIYQAVPVFFVLMAVNALMSFKRRNYTVLSSIYPNYLKSRFERIVYPLIVVWILSLVIAVLLNKEIYIGTMTLIGYMPLSGPGNYFISILLQFVLLFPILYWLYKYNPKYVLIAGFILNFAFEVLAAQVPALGNNSYWYRACILRYLFLIVLGMWLVDNFEPARLKSLIKRKNLLIGLVVSIIYITGVSIFSLKFPYFQGSWQPQTVLSFFYPLFLCALGIKYLPSVSNRVWNSFRVIGKASYHIFLVQMLFFVSGLQLIIFDLNLQNVLVVKILAVSIINVLILVGLGLLFYYMDSKIAFVFNHCLSGTYNLYKTGLLFYNRKLRG